MLRVFRDGSRYFLFSLNLSFKGLWEIVNFLLQLKVKNNIINDILHSIYIKVLLATVFRYSRQSVVHHGRGCLIAIDAIFLSTKDLFISCTLNLNYHNKIIITNINFRCIFRQLYVNVLLFLNLLLGRNLLIFFCQQLLILHGIYTEKIEHNTQLYTSVVQSRVPSTLQKN